MPTRDELLSDAWRPASVDRDGRVSREVPCAQCGYFLKGLDWQGICPECGGSIEMTVSRRYFETANPAWLKKLELGARLLRWHLATCFALPPALFVAAQVLSQMHLDMNGPIFDALPLILLSALQLLGLVGNWCITMGNPEQRVAQRSPDRLRARWLTVAWFASTAFTLALGELSHTFNDERLAILWLTSLLILRAASVIFEMQWVIHLATLLPPDPFRDIQSNARLIQGVWGFVTCLLTLTFAITWFTARIPNITPCFLVPVMLLAWGIQPVHFIVFWKFSKPVSAVRKRALELQRLKIDNVAPDTRPTPR